MGVVPEQVDGGAATVAARVTVPVLSPGVEAPAVVATVSSGDRAEEKSQVILIALFRLYLLLTAEYADVGVLMRSPVALSSTQML